MSIDREFREYLRRCILTDAEYAELVTEAPVTFAAAALLEYVGIGDTVRVAISEHCWLEGRVETLNYHTGRVRVYSYANGVRIRMSADVNEVTLVMKQAAREE